MTMFVIENKEFGWDEIVLAAETWGEWRSFFEATRLSLACLRLATKTGRLPAAAETREVADAYRYAHNLISADEARSWLSRWGLTVDEWMDYLRGQMLRDRWSNRLEEKLDCNPVTDQEVTRVVRCHAVCADKLGEWSRRLAGRAAVATRSGIFETAPLSSIRSSEELVYRIETEFQLLRQRIVTPKLIESKIADHRLDWIRVDSRYIWFGEERIAREAALCVSYDGLTLEEVAHDARAIVQQWSFYLDEIEPATRSRFLAARKGDWLGPIKMIEGFPLFSIVGKRMPAADDLEIRDRAEQALIAGMMEQAIDERVTWIR